MAYFVTGATGFIGRHLVQELLDNREGEIYVLVREGSRERLDELIERWGAGDRVVGRHRRPHQSRSSASTTSGSTSTRGNDRPLLPPRRDATT